MTAVAKQAGINLGTLSKIEKGESFPKDEMIPTLEAAYGAMISDWYPPMTLLAIEWDDAHRDALRTRMFQPLTVMFEPFVCDGCAERIINGSEHLDNCPRNHYAGKGYGATGGNFSPPPVSLRPIT